MVRRTVDVKAHKRTLKSGTTTQVRRHTRTIDGGSGDVRDIQKPLYDQIKVDGRWYNEVPDSSTKGASMVFIGRNKVKVYYKRDYSGEYTFDKSKV